MKNTNAFLGPLYIGIPIGTGGRGSRGGGESGHGVWSEMEAESEKEIPSPVVTPYRDPYIKDPQRHSSKYVLYVFHIGGP